MGDARDAAATAEAGPVAGHGYPTWRRVGPDIWESEERLGGTPDFVATRHRGVWRLKLRTSAKAVSGFASIDDVRGYVTDAFAAQT
jgi:hypothetical protein